MTPSSSFQAVILTTVAIGALCVSGGAQAQFKQTNLASDIRGLATLTDPNLVNTWGVSAIAGGSPFWIDNQGTATSSLFAVTGSTGIAPVNLNGAPGTNFAAIPGAGGPTGTVSNSGASFVITGGPSAFIFANLNGTLSAWNGSNVNPATMNAATVVATAPGASFTGLAMNSAGNLLYAANDAGTGSIDVFNGAFAPTTLSGDFVDPDLAPGFVPFNVEDIGGKVYVAYAVPGHIPQTMATSGEGAVAVFDESGNFQQQLVSPGGQLASPWGMAIAPAGFGAFGGDLLVGNFSFVDGGVIDAFNATTGAFAGSIDVDPGAGQTNGGLWDLTFGSGGPTGDPMTLYFTDGIDGETHGLFGALAAPEPSTWGMMLVGFGVLGLFAARRRRLVAL